MVKKLLAGGRPEGGGHRSMSTPLYTPLLPTISCLCRESPLRM